MTRSVARGHVAGAYRASAARRGADAFVSEPVQVLTLDLAGIVGEMHAGATRRAGPREPWLPRGTVMRNDRQVTALGAGDLARIVEALSLAELAPEWLGANLLIDGIDDFSRIPAGSRLAFGGNGSGQGRFDGGAVLRVEGYNTPCRRAGRAVARACGRPEIEFAFVRGAAGLRGVTLSVDISGAILTGDPVVVIPPSTAPAEKAGRVR